MMKRLICLLLCLSLLGMTSGCGRTLEASALPAQTLPPAAGDYEPPVGDTGLNHTRTVALYLPSADRQRLVTEYVSLQLNSGRHDAESVVRALLTQPGKSGAPALYGGVSLSLYGNSPVEVCGSVCTVNLGASALQLSRQDFYSVCMALAATLCELDGVHYVNVLVADQAVGMDITDILPLGSQTGRPGEELPVLWEQLEARRTPLGENPADTPLSSVATLYFPLEGGAGIGAETRTLSFAGQSPDQQAGALMDALLAGAQYLTGACDMSALPQLMSARPRVTELDDGGRMVNLYFHVGLQESLKAAGIDMACLMAAMTYTLTTFIPSVSSVRAYVGDTPVTSLYSAVHGNLIFQGGLMQRHQFSAFLMEQTTLYFASGDRLSGVRRSMPFQQARHPRALLLALMQGPTRQELDAGLEPVLPDGLGDADVLGLAIEGDTLLIHLSARFAELLSTQAAEWEQQACYAMVNTLGEALGVKRVRFFFGGGMLEELGGRLYWGGEFMLNPSLIDKSRG